MPNVAPLPDLVLYTRPSCSLCDEAREAIDLVIADRRVRGEPVPAVIERNIEDDSELHRRYLERIPVVELGDQRVELVVSVGKLRRMLSQWA
jgi:glutaredoxin